MTYSTMSPCITAQGRRVQPTLESLVVRSRIRRAPGEKAEECREASWKLRQALTADRGYLENGERPLSRSSRRSCADHLGRAFLNPCGTTLRNMGIQLLDAVIRVPALAAGYPRFAAKPGRERRRAQQVTRPRRRNPSRAGLQDCSSPSGKLTFIVSTPAADEALESLNLVRVRAHRQNL